MPTNVVSGHGFTVARGASLVVTPGSETGLPLRGDYAGGMNGDPGRDSRERAWALVKARRYTPGAHVGVAELVDALG